MTTVLYFDLMAVLNQNDVHIFRILDIHAEHIVSHVTKFF